MPGPLEGVRVVELGQLIAGPFCGQLLADLGADVVKVEPPGVGDPLRQWGWSEDGKDSLWWRVTGRGKRSVTIDLRSPAGQGLLKRLVAEVDVLVENFRPGTMERWGLGYDELASINAGLVMVRVSGWGQTGPSASRGGYASIGEAVGGLRVLTGYPDRPPTRVGISLGDTYTGTLACVGALAALLERQRTGRGQVVDAAIYESVLALTESIVPEHQVAGRLRPRSGPALDKIAPSNVYPTADGEVIVAANQDTVFARLATAVGMPWLISDPRFVDHRARGEHMAEIDAIIAGWTSTRPSSSVLAVLDEAGVPCGGLYTPAEMAADPHFAARQAIVEVDDPDYGPLRMPGVVPRLSRTPGAVRSTGPRLGAHTDEVLAELGCTPDDITALRSQGVL